MSTVKVRRNGDILCRFTHTQGRGVPGGFEDDGPRWVRIGGVKSVAGGWEAKKDLSMNVAVGRLKVRALRRDAVAELLGALGLSRVVEAGEHASHNNV